MLSTGATDNNNLIIGSLTNDTLVGGGTSNSLFKPESGGLADTGENFLPSIGNDSKLATSYNDPIQALLTTSWDNTSEFLNFSSPSSHPDNLDIDPLTGAIADGGLTGVTGDPIIGDEASAKALVEPISENYFGTSTPLTVERSDLTVDDAAFIGSVSKSTSEAIATTTIEDESNQTLAVSGSSTLEDESKQTLNASIFPPLEDESSQTLTVSTSPLAENDEKPSLEAIASPISDDEEKQTSIVSGSAPENDDLNQTSAVIDSSTLESESERTNGGSASPIKDAGEEQTLAANSSSTENEEKPTLEALDEPISDEEKLPSVDVLPTVKDESNQTAGSAEPISDEEKLPSVDVFPTVKDKSNLTAGAEPISDEEKLPSVDGFSTVKDESNLTAGAEPISDEEKLPSVDGFPTVKDESNLTAGAEPISDEEKLPSVDGFPTVKDESNLTAGSADPISDEEKLPPVDVFPTVKDESNLTKESASAVSDDESKLPSVVTGFETENNESNQSAAVSSSLSDKPKNETSENRSETDSSSGLQAGAEVTPSGTSLEDSSVDKQGGSNNQTALDVSNPDFKFDSGVFKVGASGEVGIDFLFDGGWYKGQLALVSLKGMEKFVPGSKEFTQELARRALSNSELGHVVISDPMEGARFSSGALAEGNFNAGEYFGAKTFAMTPGDEFGVMLVPNGTVFEVFDNPEIGGTKRPLFSMVTANPNEAFHVGQITDVTGEGNTFVMEDLRVDRGSDRDFNDFIFQVRGAVGKAVVMDDMIAPGNDWRTSDLGKGLIAYAKTYINPDLENDFGETDTELVDPLDATGTASDTGAIASPTSNDSVEVPTEFQSDLIEQVDVKAEAQIGDFSVSEVEVTPSSEIVDTPVEFDNSAPAVIDSAIADFSLTVVSESEIVDKPTKPTVASESAIVDSPIVVSELAIVDSPTSPTVVSESAIVDSPTSPTVVSESAIVDSQVLPTVVSELAIVDSQVLPAVVSESAIVDSQVLPAVVPTESPIFDKQIEDSLVSPDILTDKIPVSPDIVNTKTAIFNEPAVAPKDTVTGEKVATPPTSSSIPPAPSAEPVYFQSPKENQPLTGIIATKNSDGYSSPGNADAPVWVSGDIDSKNWAKSLVEFVDAARKSGQPNAVVNLSIELTQVNPDGTVTPRSELTVEERAALTYAQQHNAVVVVPAGDNPGQISALGQVSKEFDNIVTVGAAQRVNNAIAISKAFALAPYSGSGDALHILAEGNSGSSDSGTTVAAAKATSAISQVWAANPDLNYTQVIDIVKQTATDLGKPNWDASTGTGMLNAEAAVWMAKVTTPLPKNPLPPIAFPSVGDITLTPAQPTTTVDLSKVFAENSLHYEIVDGNSESLALDLSGDRLQLNGLPNFGTTNVTIRARDAFGKSTDTKFSVTNYYLSQSDISAVNTSLGELAKAINSNPEGLLAGLSSPEGEEAIAQLTDTLSQNPDLIQVLGSPEALSKFGLNDTSAATLSQLLQSQELAEELGLSVLLGEALSQPDSTLLDSYLLNADEAIHLLPSDAKQPFVGFIDFTEGGHALQVTETFASVNPLGKYDTLKVSGGNWDAQLVKFVDKVKLAGEKQAIANLSFDLSQLDEIGTTTRYELTPEEQKAIQYARENNVLLVVAAGNTGSVMSALGAASNKFDNIITVGAVNQFESKADYSGYGEGLTLMAPGGSWLDEPKAFVGTSRATAYVTAAASLVWAANPELSFQQVKQLLIDTAADLDVPGWDVQTGAGLVDIKEAIDRAPFVEPEKPGFSEKPAFWDPFSGEGRVKTLARASSDKTEKAIEELDNIQQSLLEQWQVLADLGNPALTLSELDAEVQQKIAEAFEKYQLVSTEAAITTAQAQQWAEALALATQHYQIEQARLLELQTRQKELEEQLAGIGQQKTALEAETQQLLDGIKKQIAEAESDLAKSQAKLSNPFAGVGNNLQTDPQPWRNAAAWQQQLAQNFRQQAGALAAESQHYQAAANGINPNRWQVVDSRSRLSGRRKEVRGWGQNPQLVKQKNQNQWLAGIAAQNSQILQQLAAQTDRQAAALNQYGQFLEDRKNSLNLGSGSADNAVKVLQLLQQEAAQQQALANNYLQQANIAEQRRQQSQSNADWHNSQIKRWEVIGTKRTGRSGRNVENVYGWRHYPEHIAPRDRAQQLAWQAEGERQTYAQLAQQAQQQANALAEQARKLQERLRDWPVLKQGIEYQIAADSWRLQAEKDLLAMHEPVQEQKLETLNLQISQTDEELQRLTSEKLPAQQQLTDATEQRLQETQSEVETIQKQRESAQKNLQKFLETAGFLLPYRERLGAVEKTIQQLEDDKLKVQETVQQLALALLQTPSEPLRQQLNHWSDYVETLNQELAWANLQKDQLALALADSPERLAISGLIKELSGAKGTAVADDVPVQQYVDLLQKIEGSGANFLEGFDNLEQRLAVAKTEQDNAELALKKLQEEYRHLGLQKANLEDNLIPAKEQQIEQTKQDIAATETTLANLQAQLPGLQDAQAQKAVEVANQEAVVAATQVQTQAQIANIQNQIAAKDAQIQQQQAVAQSYLPQIQNNYNAAAWYEQQRQAHQDAANYWNSQIQTWGIVRWEDRGYWKRSLFRRGWVSNWQPVYGWIYNPQAEANRNAHQHAANINAQYRDTSNLFAQQLTAALNATNQQINALNQQKATLIQQQQDERNKLAAQQATLQRLQQQLQAISQQINLLQANIQQQEQKLDELNNLLPQQQQQLVDLQAQIPLLEQQLIDKYRAIELTEKYLSQVEGEVNRLDARLDLLDRAGFLEQKYQDNWQQWQQATQQQTQATEALIATRQAGESDRALLASLQSQLTPAQTNLQKAQTLQQSIADTQQALEFSKLQLGNQHLLLQSLIDRENSLAALERYYLNLSEASRQRIWSGGKYNAAEAAAYRSYLEQASFVGDIRNKGWQERQQTEKRINELNQQIIQQQSQIATQQSQLATLGGIAQLQAQIASLTAAIAPVNKRLEPLQILERQQTEAIANAGTLTQNLTSELVQTAQLQATALRQLIGFGILASESDVDFFLTQVEPKVNSAIDKLRQRQQELTKQVENARSRTATAERQLANTKDEVSKQALTNLINQLKAQQSSLEELKAQNQNAADELEDLLNQARASLTPLREKQELEIRQKLESNDERLQALQSQLNSENAAETAGEADTVLAHAQLNDQIRQDLTLNASNWTQQLLAGHQMTKELGTSQQNLSASVDELIAYIQNNFAEPHGEYNRSEANLRDGITTLGVVENRADELDSAFTSTEDAIERIKLRIQQDAELWEEIAPIAIRYGVESEQLKEYLQMPGDAKSRRAAFLAKYPDNGTAIDLLTAATLEGRNPDWQISQQLNTPYADGLLNAEAVEGRNPLQALFDKSKAEQASHEAQGYALLSQAAWYEQQAAYHWAVSRKQGPTWTEMVWERAPGKCGRKGKGRWVPVTHVDHNWIIWQQYSQIFPQLRQQGYAHLVEADKWRKEKERLEPLKNQWVEANDAANEANPAVKEARNFFAQLEAARNDIPKAEIQLQSLETLLPTLKQQLEQAEAEAAAQNAKVQQEWDEYDADSEEYRAAIADILQRRGELNKQAIETQQQIAESEKWVERQSVALSEELDGVKTLIDSLQQQRQNIANEIVDLVKKGVTVDSLDELYSKDAQLEQSLQMLTNKATVLTAQQTALTQKRILLTAQNEVILAEQRLLDAYVNDSDADTSNLEQQLLDAREALAEAQRLAEQAEAASKALTAPLQEIKTDLLAQNDEHLKVAKERQAILKQLVEATQLNANYTLQAAQKQQEVNNLELQILQRLQAATAAGYGEAKALLDVAKHNDIATAAEIYYRDYKDLASDKGGKCAPGLARPEDRILADRYYQDMLANRELQRRARSQADAFRVAKETAQAQMNVLQQQQATAQQLLNELNAKVAETQEEREKKQQELAIAQARLDGITRIREQTEQTFTQLVTLEKLNLAQAQLEQEIAQNRQADIDEAVAARQERDRLELERKRLETQARIEQLRQLQVEDELRQSLNEVRGNLGLATLDATEDPVQLQTQLAGLLTNLQDLQAQQPELPENVKALLKEAQGDIHEALQGKEAASIQQNLLNAMDGLIEQIQAYKTEINRIDLEEQWDNQLLQTAQSDLQGASQQLLKELERSAALQGEHDVIDPLYMEALNKVALADQAVDISEDMAKQSKEMLEQIIKQRIAERKARKKSFWQKLLGIISGVIGILGTILSFTPLAPLGIALTAASAGINAIQSIMNGDWLGGIFGIVMAGVNALTAGMGNVLSQGTKLAIQGLQSVAAGAFNGVRSMMSGDSIMGFLQILGGVAGAVTSGLSNFINQCSSTMQHMVLQVFNSLQNVPTMIYSGIKAIQNGDWFSAIGSFFNSVMTLGGNFAGVFNDTAAKAFEYLSKIGNTGLAIGGAIKDGSIESWLSGINSIIQMWGPDIMNLIDRLNGEPLDPTLFEYGEEPLDSDQTCAASRA